MSRLRLPNSVHLLMTYSLPLFLALLFFLGVLLYHFHSLQNEVLETYQKIKVSHGLSVQLVDFSEENYHTQLEVWEYVVLPTEKRLKDFEMHKNHFFEKLHNISTGFHRHQDIIDEEVLDKMKYLEALTPEVEAHWNKVLHLAKTQASRKDLLKALEESEDYFDDVNFNERVGFMVRAQGEMVARYEDQMSKLLTNRNGVVGLLLALCFGFLVTVIHRKSLLAKQNEVQLVQASKLASLGELSAGLAHELNTPLMVIQGFNGRMKARFRKDEVSESSPLWEFSREVEEGVQRMKTILEHFRNFSRPASVEVTPVSLNEILRASFTLLMPQAGKEGVQVEWDLTSDSLMVWGNNTRLEQVFLNILKNALDALEMKNTGERKILKIRSRAFEFEAVIEIEDNGPGIPPGQIHKVFDPFFTTKPIGKGTGLGLSVSHGIVQEHKGRIEVRSELDQGCQFRLIFPLLRSPSI